MPAKTSSRSVFAQMDPFIARTAPLPADFARFCTAWFATSRVVSKKQKTDAHDDPIFRSSITWRPTRRACRVFLTEPGRSAWCAKRHNGRPKSQKRKARMRSVRYELLQLRFQDGLPIREIGRRWNIEAKKLQREYSKAKQEFLQALRDVVTAQSPMALPAEINRHCEELLELFA